MKKWEKVIFIFLFATLIIVSIIAFLFWEEIKRFEPTVYYYVPPPKSFIYTDEELKYGIEKYLRETVEKEKKRLIESKNSFIYADLKDMKISLYKEGEKFKVFPIQAKGADWFWGETPPGVYSVGFKTRLHFSSVARVWMPYAVQYFGNYFIHGWPYDRRGRPLSLGVSGGCIRLLTKDAAVLFEFAKENMPILVFDEKTPPPLPALIPSNKEILPPEIKSQSFLVADLDTGEILLSKEIDSEIYAGPLVKGMLALTASETVNLEKRIIARSWMLKDIREGLIVLGKNYRGYDLLHPLLSQSSKEAALVLTHFLNPEIFVNLMNTKAKGIGMKNTNFVDVIGISKENKTTLSDAARMMRYLKDYKIFILNISQKLTGKGENHKETSFLVLEMGRVKNCQTASKKEILSNGVRTIFIGIANSSNAKQDLKNILIWLNTNFGLGPIKKDIK